MKRKFDWRPKFDPRSKNYSLRDTLRSTPRRVDTLWRVGPILDQGSEGACVGFGWTAQTLADPFSSDLTKIPKAHVPKEPQPFAFYVYKSAQKIDEWPGEDYEGTSVLAGARIMKRYKLISSYSWAFSLDDVVDGIIARGPVVLGIPWYESMYEAPRGRVVVSGKEVGGHCILAVGYRRSSEKFGGRESVILQNSWGPSWGESGLAEISLDDLSALLRKQGEACLPSLVAHRSAQPKRVLMFRLRACFRGFSRRLFSS
jgi:hypothetical protein